MNIFYLLTDICHPERMLNRSLLGLTLAHVANDINQSALPAILAFLVPARGLSLGAAATLILAMNLSSSLVQPLVGHWSDRRPLGWTIPLSLLMGGLGTALVGFMPSFGHMLAVCLLAGVGVAAFHPEASRRVNELAGEEHRGAAMSWFTIGGYLGFALGPVLVTPFLLGFGLHGTAVLAVPALLAAAGMALQQAPAGRAAVGSPRAAKDDWRAFGWLSLVVGMRSVVFFGSVTFLPLFHVQVLGTTAAQGNSALTLMLLAAAGGTLAGGRLADHRPRNGVVTLSAALMSGLALTTSLCGPELPRVAALSVAALLGLATGLSASVMVVLGQEYLPNRLGIASGVTLGLAVSAGGLGVPLLGMVGDLWGLSWVFAAMAAIAGLVWLASLNLPVPGASVVRRSARGRSPRWA